MLSKHSRKNDDQLADLSIFHLLTLEVYTAVTICYNLLLP